MFHLPQLRLPAAILDQVVKCADVNRRDHRGHSPPPKFFESDQGKNAYLDENINGHLQIVDLKKIFTFVWGEDRKMVSQNVDLQKNVIQSIHTLFSKNICIWLCYWKDTSFLPHKNGSFKVSALPKDLESELVILLDICHHENYQLCLQAVI